MADYKKLSSDESGFLDLSDLKKPFNSLQENQSLLDLKNFSPRKSDKLEFISSDSQTSTSPKSPTFPFNLNFDSLTPSYLIKKPSSSPPTPSSMNRARKGNMIMAMYNEDESPFIVIGPEWIFPLLLFGIIFSVIFFYFYFYWKILSFNLKLWGVGIFLGEVISFLLCAITNPGIPSKNLWVENYYKNKNNNKNYSYGICKECKLIKRNTDGIEHCDKCGVCIIGRKKHSFLLSKCIGEKNKIFYYTFVVISVAFVGYILFGWSLVNFFSDNIGENNGEGNNNAIANNSTNI